MTTHDWSIAGKTVLLTGATDGIGLALARELDERGARLLLHGRDGTRGKRLLADLDGDHAWYPADLASLARVDSLTATVMKNEPRLEVLICNAGVYRTELEHSAEGFELTWAVNHLAHFLLVNRLVYLLARSEPSRVVIVASMAHRFTDGIPLEDAANPTRYDAGEAYARSKGANIAFTLELARRLTGSGIAVGCLHPGVISTKLLHAGFGPGGEPPRRGALRVLRLADELDAAELHGRYFENDRPVEPAAHTRNPELQRGLWERSEHWTGLA